MNNQSLNNYHIMKKKSKAYQNVIKIYLVNQISIKKIPDSKLSVSEPNPEWFGNN